MKVERADIVTLLTENDDVAALVGDRVYAALAPKSATFPYITVALTQTDRPKTHDQRAAPERRKADKRTWTVTAFSTDVDEASDIALAIDNALDGQTGATGSALFLFEDVADDAAFKSDDSDEIIFALPVTVTSFRRAVA